MKHLTNLSWTYPGLTAITFNKTQLSQSRFTSSQTDEPAHFRATQLLTPEARLKISAGNFPNLTQVCHELVNTFTVNNYPFKATQFLEVLKKVELTPAEVQQILHHTDKRHVLVQNELIKIVLIQWTTDDFAPIHGHPAGGCVLKVLKGKIVEKRYTPDHDQKMVGESKLHTGAMAYIDDTMAYHAVLNPFKRPAISLHVYTPGVKI